MDSFSDEEVRTASSHPTPQDLPTFLPYACAQLGATFRVKINIQIQGEYQMINEKQKKSRRLPANQAHHTSVPASATQEQESEFSSPEYIDEGTVVLTVVMDRNGRLLELVFNRCRDIPRDFIKVIGFCIPYQRFLYRLTVRWSPLTTVAIHEFSKILYASQLTEICFDDSPVAGRNYELLLDQPSHLCCLSLARCKLDDQDCVKIAATLAHPRPASKTLNVLSLASNRIGDKGACALGHVLRTNRCLQYLNLAGNHISDIGAISIFKSLMQFPITNDELFKKRSRRFEYLRLKNEVYARCIKELWEGKSHDEVRLAKRRTINRAQRNISLAAAVVSSAEAVCQKAEAMTTELIGTFDDPFSSDQIVTRDGQVYCVGNVVLCCLNLAYNDLEYASITLLHDVLLQQTWQEARTSPSAGLVRVGIEGNNLPGDCKELMLIDELLEIAQGVKTKQGKRVSEKFKRKIGRSH